jgi:hypothetical protein
LIEVLGADTNAKLATQFIGMEPLPGPDQAALQSMIESMKPAAAGT